MSIIKRIRQLITDQKYFPRRWQVILDQNVPLLRNLDDPTRQRLYRRIGQFLKEKKFEGVKGQRIDEEVRLTIAAQACLIHIDINGPLYPKLRTIIVYPTAYLADEVEQRDGGVEIRDKQIRVGESWAHGTMVLTWQEVIEGAADPGDGRNLVFHECAHKLDEETGESNGSPVLPNPQRQHAWEHAFSNAFETVRRAIDHGSTIGPFNPYAASNPAEFFAVATELYFERPGVLRAFDRELYQQLQDFFHHEAE